MTYDIRFLENLVFYNSPGKLVNVILKDINKNIFNYCNNVQLHVIDPRSKILKWVSFPNLHLYDEVYVEIIEDGKVSYDELFFNESKKSYIKKEDLTIVVKTSNIINKMISYYSKYGKVQYDMNNIDTKYVLILNKYLLNITYFLNKMFFNYKILSESDDKSVKGSEKDLINSTNIKIIKDLRFLKEEIWRDK